MRRPLFTLIAPTALAALAALASMAALGCEDGPSHSSSAAGPRRPVVKEALPGLVELQVVVHGLAVRDAVHGEWR